MRYGQPAQRQSMFGGGTAPRQTQSQGYGQMRYRNQGQSSPRPPQPMPMPKQPEDYNQMAPKPVQDLLPKAPMPISGRLDTEGRPGAYLPPANPQSEGITSLGPKPSYGQVPIDPKPQPTLAQRFAMMTQGAPMQSTMSPGLVRPDETESFMRRPGMGIERPEVDPEELDARRRLFSIMR